MDYLGENLSVVNHYLLSVLAFAAIARHNHRKTCSEYDVDSSDQYMAAFYLG